MSVDPSTVSFLRAAGADAFLGWIDGVELVLPNIDEARVLVGSTGPQIDLDALAARFAHVVVTLGSMGAAYLGGKERIQVTAPRVGVVDTTGAGDAFAAGFLARWVEGATPEEALDGGRAAAETCVTHLGARPDVRSDQGATRVAPRCAGRLVAGAWSHDDTRTSAGHQRTGTGIDVADLDQGPLERCPIPRASDGCGRSPASSPTRAAPSSCRAT